MLSKLWEKSVDLAWVAVDALAVSRAEVPGLGIGSLVYR